ncbi:hypothetical protein SASPL_122483 [Salvia splendens]|uniref:Uncharacterized protein n=1 Tax=Salvia splendens TaxID=180675 RepID=A0A8X8XPD1_SALSN|nr:hypothetical protein SASPL_122483 [Salvia splendens]
METSPHKHAGATVPPKRGRIKAQIFESFAGTVSAVASKAVESLKIRRGGDGGSTTDSSSTTSVSSAASPCHGADG